MHLNRIISYAAGGLKKGRFHGRRILPVNLQDGVNINNQPVTKRLFCENAGEA